LEDEVDALTPQLPVKAANFNYGSDKNLIVALPNEVDMVARRGWVRIGIVVCLLIACRLISSEILGRVGEVARSRDGVDGLEAGGGRRVGGERKHAGCKAGGGMRDLEV